MQNDDSKWRKMGDACKFLGVQAGILRKWDKDGFIKTIRTPGNMRLFDITSINPSGSITEIRKKEQPSVILYARVSSAKQSQDLERQKTFLQENLPDKYSGHPIIEVSDVGSGINFKRKGLLRILGLVKENRVSTIVVASRDRLARFGWELIEWMCTSYGTQIVVLDSEDNTPEAELGKDLMAIVQVYCCRWNGLRRYKSKSQDKSDEVETTSDQGTEDKTEPMGGLREISVQQDDSTPGESSQQDSKKQVPTKRSPRNRKKQ
jgi:predicted site-specific integrase-resolvase